MQEVEDYRSLVKSPGRFEGEEAYVPYFYDLSLEGDGEDTTDGSIMFDILKADIEKFPELSGKKKIWLTIAENGFVYGNVQ